MKRLILVLLVALLASSLFSSSLRVTPRALDLDLNGHLFSLRRGVPSYHGEVLSIGNVRGIGLVRTLTDPYSSSSLVPGVSRWGSDGGRWGGIISIFQSDLVFSWDERPFLGLSLKRSYFSLGTLYAFGNGKRDEVLGDASELAILPALYLAFDFEIPYFSASSMMSITEGALFDFFLSGRFEWHSHSLSLKWGNVAPLFKRETRWNFEVEGRIETDGAYGEFSYKMGMPPIYASRYIPKEVRLEAAFDAGDLELGVRSIRREDEKGSAILNMKLWYSSGPFSVQYEREKGWSYEIDFGLAKLKSEMGGYEVSFKIPLRRDDSYISVSLSTKRIFDLELVLLF